MNFIPCVCTVEFDRPLKLLDRAPRVVSSYRQFAQTVVTFGTARVKANSDLKAFVGWTHLPGSFFNQTKQVMVAPFGGCLGNSLLRIPTCQIELIRIVVQVRNQGNNPIISRI